MTDKIQVGDWVRFYSGGWLVIGVVAYIRELRSFPYGNELDTTAGAIAEASVLESRHGEASRPGATHWDDCWRERRHHGCAIAEIERLRALIGQLTTERLTAAATEGPWTVGSLTGRAWYVDAVMRREGGAPGVEKARPCTRIAGHEGPCAHSAASLPPEEETP